MDSAKKENIINYNKLIKYRKLKMFSQDLNLNECIAQLKTISRFEEYLFNTIETLKGIESPLKRSLDDFETHY